MLQTISFNYTDAGSPANAFSVTLASPDDSYGVETLDASEVVVLADTAVMNPSVGLYRYVVNLDPDVIYRVSWKIIANEGDSPEYSQTQIGPYPAPASVAVPEFRGTFNCGTYGTLSLRIINLAGIPFDPDTITITVQQVGNPPVFTSIPEKITNGFYVYEWYVPSVAPGPYDVFWSYSSGGTPSLIHQTIQVAAQGTGTATAHNIVRYLVLRAALEALIPHIQSIPIYHEQAKESADAQAYHFTWKRWNQPAMPNVYRNNVLLTSGYSIDYLNGMVTFDVPNLSDDVVYADYNFRFYDDQNMEIFLEQAINDFNICAPQTSYHIGSIPDSYLSGPLKMAAVYAIRSFRQAIVWPQNRMLFENEKYVDKMLEVLEQDAKSYAEEADKNCERKKLFPYRGLTAIVLNQNMTLPGSRARIFRYMWGGNS